MTESIITISFVGLLAGFIFSMPVAGPISILITTSALRGRCIYCNRVSIGASLITFAYVFIALFGLSKLYHLYKPAIPWLLFTGSIFLVLLGYRVFRTNFDIEQIGDNPVVTRKVIRGGRGGFYTGLLINLLNPTLFIGWLTSTFLVITFVTSLGYNMGGLDSFVDTSVKEIGNLEVSIPGNTKFRLHENREIKNAQSPVDNIDEQAEFPPYYHLLISLFYAFFIAVGSILWFYLLALLLNRFRHLINTRILSAVIKSMGVILGIFGIYFGYLATTIFLHQIV